MSLPERRDLDIWCGSVFDEPILTWRDTAGQPVSLSGFTARMDVRAMGDVSPATPPGTPILQLTSGAGTLVLGGAAGTISFNVPAATTAALTPTVGGAEHVYDLEVISAGGVVRKLAYGLVTVHAEVTR